MAKKFENRYGVDKVGLALENMVNYTKAGNKRKESIEAYKHARLMLADYHIDITKIEDKVGDKQHAKEVEIVALKAFHEKQMREREYEKENK